MSLKSALVTSSLLRNKFKELFKTNLWKPVIGLNLQEERALALTRLKNITDNKLIDVKWFKSDPTKIFDCHEYVGYMDGSTATKMTVQFNLFGGTVLNLGSDKHHGDFLNKINTLENIGCFAFTERNFGNNAFKMETTVKYNKSNNTFTINSPTTGSHKYWITNSACHANYSVVFGRLLIGDEDHGPHPFLVKIRESDGKLSKGITIKDMGYKLGLNGVDNGELIFDNFQINADSLLDSISRVTDAGVFESTISDNKRKRFLKMADQLVSGRICISSMMLGCSKMMLYNTIRYALNRYSVGRDGESSMKIINYGIQRSTLASLLVRTIGLNLALNRAKNAYELKSEELMTLACSVKPMLGWHTQEITIKCRELTGGEGFLIKNQFSEAFAASQAGITAEGDSKVLMMKTASERIRNIKKTDIANMYMNCYFPVSLQQCFKNKETLILAELAVADSKGDRFDVWTDTHSQLIQDAGKAYCERIIYDEFEKLVGVPYSEDLKKYFMLDCITRDPLWYSKQGVYFQMGGVEKEKVQLEKRIMKHCLSDIMESFDFPEHMIHAPMAHYKFK